MPQVHLDNKPRLWRINYSHLEPSKSLCLLLCCHLAGCWHCPDPVLLEVDSTYSNIKVLSEQYYIKSVTLTEYRRKDGYIELDDSSQVVLQQVGERGAFHIHLLHPIPNYTTTGGNVESFLQKKNIQFLLRLEKFENRKKGNALDQEEIIFVKEKTNSSKKYNSKHPCP